MRSVDDEISQGFLNKQKGHKHTKKVHQERTESVEEARARRASIKKEIEDMEMYELEHDDEDGVDYSRYIR